MTMSRQPRVAPRASSLPTHAPVQRSTEGAAPASPAFGHGASGGGSLRAVPSLRGASLGAGHAIQMKQGPSVPTTVVQLDEESQTSDPNDGQSSPYAPTVDNADAAEAEANAGQSSPYAPTVENAEAAEKEKEGGEGEKKEGEGEDKKMELEFPAGECFGFSFAGNAAGATEVKAIAKIPGLPAPHWPCGPGYIEVKPEVKGSLAVSRSSDGKKWEGTLEVAASAAASFRLGVPHVASVGVGAELTGAMSMKVTNDGGKWSGTPPQLALKGGIFADVQVFETSQKVTVGEAELVKIVGGDSGYRVEMGADVANLYNRVKEAADRLLGGSSSNQGGHGGAGGGGAGGAGGGGAGGAAGDDGAGGAGGGS